MQTGKGIKGDWISSPAKATNESGLVNKFDTAGSRLPIRSLGEGWVQQKPYFLRKDVIPEYLYRESFFFNRLVWIPDRNRFGDDNVRTFA